MLNDYVRRELHFESDLPYEILTGRVRPWKWGNSENRYLNLGETLRRAMSKNPALRVFVASGYYDLATPYFATRYTFDHLGLEPPGAPAHDPQAGEAGHAVDAVARPQLARRADHDLAHRTQHFVRSELVPLATPLAVEAPILGRDFVETLVVELVTFSTIRARDFAHAQLAALLDFRLAHPPTPSRPTACM